jgi:hypothetical protein
MSKGVKVHDSIKKWDVYALFDKDNVLASPKLFTNILEAEAIRNYMVAFGDNDSISIWNVTLTRKDKVNDNNAVKV